MSLSCINRASTNSNLAESTVTDTELCDMEVQIREFEKFSECDSIFLFCGDERLAAIDKNGYWFMEKLMHSYNEVDNADEAWVWMLMLNKQAELYNRRLERYIYAELGENAARQAVKDLMDMYDAGTQSQINTASFVFSVVALYDAIAHYNRTFYYNGPYCSQLDILYKAEYNAWYKIYDALSTLLCDFAYASASYSALSMDINEYITFWAEQRVETLKAEKNLIESSYERRRVFKSEYKAVSDREFDSLIAEFEQLLPKLGSNDDGFRTRPALETLKSAIIEWREARRKITNHLSENQIEEFNQITQHLYAQFYLDICMMLDKRRY